VIQQACLNLWQTKMAMNIYPWSVLNGIIQNTYLTQFSRLLFISHLLITLHKKGYSCVGLTITWIFLTKYYLSFLSSNHNVLIFIQACRANPQIFFFEMSRNIHITYTRIFLFPCLVCSCYVHLCDMIWYPSVLAEPSVS